MTHSHTTHEHRQPGSKQTVLMLVWCQRGVQETPFEIVSISLASVLLLVLIYG